MEPSTMTGSRFLAVACGVILLASAARPAALTGQRDDVPRLEPTECMFPLGD
jgi:hypothetical protein